MGEFKSLSSYEIFSREVARQRRYVRTSEAEEFLRAVASTCKPRLQLVRKGMPLWRAQLPSHFEETTDDPLPPCRMKPKRERAFEGRVNPKGIPCLYLSTTANAAMSEVRPWIGSLVSVAQFETVRPLTIVDCAISHDQYFNLLLDWPVSPDKIDEIVWAEIDRAFAEPVTRTDDTAEYAATQTLAELFRNEGYDGVAYKSAFGEDGYSVALFDLDSARQLDGALFKTRSVEFTFEASGNPYFITGKPD